MSIAISGHVVDRRTAEGLDGLRVEAWSPAPLAEAALASTTTRRNGAFRLTFEQASESGEIPDDLVFRVFREDRLVASTEAGPRWPADGTFLRIEVETGETAPAPAIVTGRLVRRDRTGVEGMRVELADLTSAEMPLAVATTNVEGVFRIEVATQALDRRNGRSVLLRALGSTSAVLAESDPFDLQPGETIVDLELGAAGDRRLPEFERHERTIALVTGDRPLVSLADAEIERIAAEAGIESTSTERLKRAARLAEETRLPVRALYALDIAGIATDLESLSRLDREQIEEAFRIAEARGAVGPDVREDARAVLNRGREARASRAPLTEAVRVAGVGVSERLARELEEQGTHTLDDLRRRPRHERLPRPGDEEGMRQLEALSMLALLPVDLATQGRLLRTGFASLNTIAATPPDVLARSVEFPDEAAARAIHSAAKSQASALANIATLARTDAAAAGTPRGQALEAAVPASCACDRCRSASSPMAYLADLIDYAARHITVQGNAIGLAGLEARLLQPFSSLPMTCRALDERLRQARIAVEVLRKIVPANTAQWTPPAVLEQAYLMLLREHGTSFEEVRDIRTKSDREQVQFVHRLGIHVPAGQPPGPWVDMLFREPGATGPTSLTEEFLEDVFGLRDTRRDALSAQPEASILRLRLQRLREDIWVSEDWPAQAPVNTRPLIDPDLLTPEDFVDSRLTLPTERPRAATRPIHLWEDRGSEIAAWMLQIDDVTQNLGYGVEALEAFITDRVWSPQLNRWIVLNVGLGITIQDFQSYAARQAALEDITSELEALRMEAGAFAYVAAAWERLNRARPVALIAGEWNALRSILIQRLKATRFAAWRVEERSMGLTLAPQHFRLRSRVTEGGNEWQLKDWRAAPLARQQWQDKLTARTEQEAAIAEAVRTAVDAVERATLTHIRHALILAVVLPPGTRRAEWLTQRYQIDFAAGACHVTTRIAQAIETLQRLLNGARQGLLEQPELVLNAPDFDAEWQWLGSSASWSAAIEVFSHPEIALRPTLRRDKSPAFETLLETLRATGRLTPEQARKIARDYTAYFNDVCSLTPVAVYESAGWQTRNGTAAATAPCIVIARAANGTLYFSGFETRPAWYLSSVPAHTFWAPITGLPPAADVVGLVPFQPAPGDVRLALYGRTGGNGTARTWFASYDGSSWSRVTASEVPDAVTSVQYSANSVLAANGALRAAGVAGWRVNAGDRFIPLTVEGFGSTRRTALLAFAANREPDGTRRVGVLRGRDGGLELSAYNTIDGEWSLPTADPIVLSSGGLEYLLVTRSDGGLTQLGLIAAEWPGSGRPTVRWQTTDGFVYAAGNTSRWRVNATAIRIAANLENPLSSNVIALEYESTPDAWGVVGTNTRVTVLRMDGGALQLVAQPLLNHPLTDYPGACKLVTHVEASKVTAVPFGAGHRLLFLAVDYRVSIHRPGACVGIVHASVLAWEAAWNTQTASFQTVAPVADTFQPTPGLRLKGTDEFLPLRLPDGSSAVLLITQARDPLVVLKPNGFGALAEVWRTATAVIDAAVPGGSPWPLKAGDRISPAGTHLLIVREDGSELALLDATATGSLQVRWALRSRVRFPGLALEPEWLLRGGATYSAMDVDGDGAIDLVTLGTDGTLAILRTIIPVGLTGDPLRTVRPYNVGVRDIVDRRSPDWLPDRPARIRDAYDRNLASASLLRYLDEAFHFIPMELAMRLRDSGSYTAALDWIRSVYDYSQPAAARKISYKLVLDEHAGQDDTSALVRYTGWLLDPLNPHSIAEVRPHSFTRHAQLTAVRALLDFADAEFSRSTAESVPRARELYLEALELLNSPEIRQNGAACQALIRELAIDLGEGEYRWIWREIVSAMGAITNRPALEAVVGEVKNTLAIDAPLPDRLAMAQRIVTEARNRDRDEHTLGGVLMREEDARRELHVRLLGEASAERLARGLTRIRTEGGLRILTWEFVPAPRLLFCITPNPTVAAAVRHAELNLQKIRTCRNIAGLEMRLDPYALSSAATVDSERLDGAPSFRAPSLQPSPYRYAVVVERAKQLVELARQIEASLLQSLQSLSNAEYEELRARQDLALARAGVRLKDLQLVEAADLVTAGQLQSQRAEFTLGHYQGLLNGGLSVLETAGLAAQTMATSLQFAGIYSIDTLFEWAGAAAPAFAQLAQLANAGASYERRADEWRYQRGLGERDVQIARQQIRLAQDRLLIAAQERAITTEQVDHAETMLEFIQTKRFGTAALYEWMSGVLEQVYRFFLQQATAMAQLAEAQLAFERQQIPPTVIRDDYWEPPGRGARSEPMPGTTPDRGETHGLTGSARLLRDLYELDQHAFRTNQRKLQLTETISLAQLDPIVFQQFRTTGVLPFATPMSLFDARFPGHYLRLVRSVRTTVIALVPPSYGIRAVLATTGTSRTVIGGDRFQTVSVLRGPESVALSAPMNATGLFEMDIQPEMLVPFEGIGVDTTWEFRLPKASNPFDFSTIADVLVTIDYTALASDVYRQTVVAQMDRRVSADRGFSIRHQFADAWYDLHNPEQVPPARRMVASFRTKRADFPPHVEGLAITHIALYCVPNQDHAPAPLEVTNLVFQQTWFGQARTDDQGIISTRRANGAGWTGLIGRSPVGEWMIAFPDTPAMRRRFTDGAIDELLLSITYSGRLPAYPT
jgi:hypothetical protein